MRELSLFAGAGGGILGGFLLGWRTVCAVELAPYARSVLLARQRDGCLPRFSIWDDVKTFDGNPWRGHIDVVSGGFPCTDISCAGKGARITGAQSGLWKEMARIIGEVRPRYVFVENSPALRTRGLAVVLGDLAGMGYDAEWGVVSAASCGAPHIRERIWILAYAHQERCGGASEQLQDNGEVPQQAIPAAPIVPLCQGLWDESILPTLGMADGVATNLDGIEAAGNGQVPIVAATAWRILKARLEE